MNFVTLMKNSASTWKSFQKSFYFCSSLKKNLSFENLAIQQGDDSKLDLILSFCFTKEERILKCMIENCLKTS